MCGLYIKNTIPYILRNDLNVRHKNQGGDFETCLIELIHPTTNIILGVVYQHPKQKDKFFLKYLKENKKVILTGDFNLNLLKSLIQTQK